MYVPRHFAEERLDVLAAFVAANPFATLVTLAGDGLVASHLPMLWDADPAPYGTLRGHLARPNPQAKDDPVAGVDALAIFGGPHAYVSPSWYPSKREHGKVVPTWNYVVVHASGPLRRIDDGGWLHAFLTRLTDRQEATFAEPWRVSDAPEAFVAQVAKGIVGVEIPVAKLEGKWKLNQNRPDADYAATIDGLETRGDAGSSGVASAMRAWRRDHST
jgi:transcriptional regulator